MTWPFQLVHRSQEAEKEVSKNSKIKDFLGAGGINVSAFYITICTDLEPFVVGGPYSKWAD